MFRKILQDLKNSIDAVLHKDGRSSRALFTESNVPQAPVAGTIGTGGMNQAVSEPECNIPDGLLGEAYFRRFMTERGALALHRQAVLSQIIGGKEWRLDLANGYIVFDGNLVLPMQVLGGYDKTSGVWLWGWAAKEKSGSGHATRQLLLQVQPALMEQSRRLRAHGQQTALPLLTTGIFKADMNVMHSIGLLATSLFGNSGYYMAESGKALLYLTLAKDALYNARATASAFDLDVFQQFLEWCDADAAEALVPYLQGLGYMLRQSGKTLYATGTLGALKAMFDEHGSLTEITAMPNEPPHF